jgi:rubrerythrin
MAQTGIRALGGGQPQLFMDKLGERLAFERTGTRLYEALVGKAADGNGARWKGGPTRADLDHIRSEEHEHARMLETVIGRQVSDTTVVTPSPNQQATASKGIPAVLADPRTNLLECLEAILVAELADNDCWTALVELAETAGDTEAVMQFTQALAQEREHLERVRTWLAAAQGRSVEAVQMLSAAEREATSALRGERAAVPGRAERASGRSRHTGGRTGANTRRTKTPARGAAKRGTVRRSKRAKKRTGSRAT